MILCWQCLPERNSTLLLLLLLLLLLILLLLLFQLSCHSVAVVLTPVQTKQVRINTHKQTIQNTVNTSTHITKTPTQISQHLQITKPVKTTTVQDTCQKK